MTEIHYHVYDISAFPEGRCACGDLGMFPPVIRDPGTVGPLLWCQVCGAKFLSMAGALDHVKESKITRTMPLASVVDGRDVTRDIPVPPICALPVIVQLRGVL